jgi:uncharacterized membrane protein YcaP (DUF421 family)
MSDLIYTLFGEEKDVNVLQMVMRAIVIFVFTLIIIRISGRRSFGMSMPFDNITAILLGALLSRAVAGSSPFWPVVAAAAAIALLHRLVAWIAMYSRTFAKIVKGESRVIFSDGKLHRENMNMFQIGDKDLEEEIRINGNINTFDKVKEAYCERNGHISVVKKEE